MFKEIVILVMNLRMLKNVLNVNGYYVSYVIVNGIKLPVCTVNQGKKYVIH